MNIFGKEKLLGNYVQYSKLSAKTNPAMITREYEREIYNCRNKYDAELKNNITKYFWQGRRSASKELRTLKDFEDNFELIYDKFCRARELKNKLTELKAEHAVFKGKFYPDTR